MAAYYEGEYGDHSMVKYRLHAFAQAVQAAERERWTRRVEEAFREGYYSRETYNDKDTTMFDTSPRYFLGFRGLKNPLRVVLEVFRFVI